jgi:hypothetical protein
LASKTKGNADLISEATGEYDFLKFSKIEKFHVLVFPEILPKDLAGFDVNFS